MTSSGSKGRRRSVRVAGSFGGTTPDPKQVFQMRMPIALCHGVDRGSSLCRFAIGLVLVRGSISRIASQVINCLCESEGLWSLLLPKSNDINVWADRRHSTGAGRDGSEPQRREEASRACGPVEYE